MNLEFPTDLPVPLCSIRPGGELETGDCASLGKLSELLQHPSDRSDFAPAGVHLDEANPEVANSSSPEFNQAAISAIIKNIAANPTKEEYFWDAALERWLLRVVPF